MCAALVLTLASASWAARRRPAAGFLQRGLAFCQRRSQRRRGQAGLRDYPGPVLATGAAFAKDPNFAHRRRPAGDLGADVAYTQAQFDDQPWRRVTCRTTGRSKGRSIPRPRRHGQAAERRHRLVSQELHRPGRRPGRQVYFWTWTARCPTQRLAERPIVGGWPYGYASWRVDLTPYVKPGGENQLAIRLDNPAQLLALVSGRRHLSQRLAGQDPPGARGPVGHVSDDAGGLLGGRHGRSGGHGRQRLPASARMSACPRRSIALDAGGHAAETPSPASPPLSLQVPRGRQRGRRRHGHRRQSPALGTAAATEAQSLRRGDHRLAGGQAWSTRTRRGSASATLQFDPDGGFFVNGERIPLNGVNNHHDLGALGAAFNIRACSASSRCCGRWAATPSARATIPPAPELLELTDRMGFLVMDEAFDAWVRQKTPLDFHLIFPDWHEQDLRALVRRDRNHPSVILWSIGNEVGEQYTGEEGAALARRLCDIVHEEDPTRPATTAMNSAKPDMPFAAAVDVISLNYQGEGIRDIPGRVSGIPPQTLSRTRSSSAARPRPPSAAAASTCSPSPTGSARPCGTEFRRRFDDPPGERLRALLRRTSAPPRTRCSARTTSIRTWPASSCGPAGTTSASRRPTTRPAVPTPASSTWPASRRTASTSTRRTGVPIFPWRTSCRTGPGRTASGRSRRCTSSPPATRPSCSSTASRSARRRRANTNTASAGTT